MKVEVYFLHPIQLGDVFSADYSLIAEIFQERSGFDTFHLFVFRLVVVDEVPVLGLQLVSPLFEDFLLRDDKELLINQSLKESLAVSKVLSQPLIYSSGVF